MAGRKEILTLELARNIARMIELFPDHGISVTWDNVVAQSKRQFGYGGNRQMLGQKKWSGRKLISEAFHQAKQIQRRLQGDRTPKYQTAPRSVLQKRIATLESEKLALTEELERVRAHKYSELDAFLNNTTDVRSLLSKASSFEDDPSDTLASRRLKKTLSPL